MKDYFWLTGNDEKACIRLKNVVSLQRINGINDMRQIINYLYLVIVVLMTGCAGCGDTKDEAQTDKEFDQIKNVADSLYSRMQFRDAYDLYLQLLSLAKQTGNDFYHSMALMEMGQHVFLCIQFQKTDKASRRDDARL